MKSLHLTNLIASSVIDPFTFTGLLIRVRRSESGRATRLTVKTLRGRILMTVDLNRSYREESPGAGELADAPIYFLHRDDREPTRTEPAGWLAI